MFYGLLCFVGIESCNLLEKKLYQILTARVETNQILRLMTYVFFM